MFADPNNPFAAAVPKNGSAPSPFQSAPSEGQSSHVPPSPFGVAPRQNGFGQALPQEGSVSPFALVSKIPEPRISEPSEGFAEGGAGSDQSNQGSAPVSMPPLKRGPNGRDPFAIQPSQEEKQPSPSDFVIPAERTMPPEVSVVRVEPSPQSPPVAQPAHFPASSSQPVSSAPVRGDMPQLVLRAIFGVTQELNKNEIIQRARTLPGVRNLHLLGSDEGKAMACLRASVQRMGFGDQHSLSLYTDAGEIDIIEEAGATLAVLHEGNYGAGVRETLIIVARELARLA